jgi:hypothetical protein
MCSLSRLLVVVVLTTVAVTSFSLACNIDQVRQSVAGGSRPGGWFPVSVNDTVVGQLRDLAAANTAASDNVAAVTKTLKATEAYRQVVSGTNYCIRLNAAGDCASHHCENYECVAFGHKPLPTGGNVMDFSNSGVTCEKYNDTCDIEGVRQLAKTPMPGGWFEVTSNSISDVDPLLRIASVVAGLQKGRLVEAYSQTVAGNKYCIRFESTGLEQCQPNCVPMNCVASGFQPLLQSGSTSPEPVVKQIGVNCQRAAAVTGVGSRARGDSSSDVSAGWSSVLSSAVTSFMTASMAFVALAATAVN